MKKDRQRFSIDNIPGKQQKETGMTFFKDGEAGKKYAKALQNIRKKGKAYNQ